MTTYPPELIAACRLALPLLEREQERVKHFVRHRQPWADGSDEVRLAQLRDAIATLREVTLATVAR